MRHSEELLDSIKSSLLEPKDIKLELPVSITSSEIKSESPEQQPSNEESQLSAETNVPCNIALDVSIKSEENAKPNVSPLALGTSSIVLNANCVSEHSDQNSSTSVLQTGPLCLLKEPSKMLIDEPSSSCNNTILKEEPLELDKESSEPLNLQTEPVDLHTTPAGLHRDLQSESLALHTEPLPLQVIVSESPENEVGHSNISSTSNMESEEVSLKEHIIKVRPTCMLQVSRKNNIFSVKI